MSAIDVQKIDYPASAMKDGATNQNAFQITGCGYTIGVLYAVEPFRDDGSAGIHFSISKTESGRPAIVDFVDLMEVEKVLQANGLRTPDFHETERFQAGPFVGRGLHVWEK